ncbi:type II secretion system protein GspM [Thermomonas brevis]
MPRADRDRWLALALLLAVVGLLYLLVVHPLFTAPLRAADARIAGLQERDARARGLLAQRVLVDQRLAELQAQGGTAGFLSEPTTELATAALILQLERVVGEASPGNRGCAIVNRAPAESEVGSERYRRVAVQVRLRCGNTETLTVLQMLESARPYLFVDLLSITAQRYFSVPGAAAPQEGGLDVNFQLYGYLLPSATGGGDGG